MSRGIIEHAQPILHKLLGTSPSDRLNAPYACPDATFRDNAKQANVACLVDMGTGAQLLTEGLSRYTYADNSDFLSILLTEKGHRAPRDSLVIRLDRRRYRGVVQHCIIRDFRDLPHLIRCQRAAMGKVEA